MLAGRVRSHVALSMTSSLYPVYEPRPVYAGPCATIACRSCERSSARYGVTCPSQFMKPHRHHPLIGFVASHRCVPHPSAILLPSSMWMMSVRNMPGSRQRPR